MPKDVEELSAASAGSMRLSCRQFDDEVAAIRAAGIKPRHKPYGKLKAECRPEEWAAHLEWRAAYYAGHREEWDMYRNRWLARRHAISH